MEKVYLSINIPNIVTVGIMMLIWFALLGSVNKWKKAQNGEG